MAARSLGSRLRVVLRAGDGEITDETRSLEQIGPCSTCTGWAPRSSPGVALGSDADSVALRGGKAELLLPEGERETAPLEIAR